MALAMPLSDPAVLRAPSSRELDVVTLARCCSQDPMAFRAFVVRYERAVFALLSRVLGRGPHVEDLAQEAFLRAFRAFPDFDVAGAAKPSTWLLTLATRLALDARKKRVLPPAPEGAADVLASPMPTPEVALSHAQLGRAIEAAATELSDDQRAAFVLAEFHDLSLAEIAVALGVPENTVKTRLFRAREQMKKRLAGMRERSDG